MAKDPAQPSDDSPTKEQWATRIGVILAVAGSAVGLGNFLRFPGQAAANGGGAFLLPYFISLLVLGIPLCWAEWIMGRHAGVLGMHSAPAVFTSIWNNRLAKYFGGMALLIPLVIYMYYVLIEAWCLGYAINYLNGNLMIKNGTPEDYGNFFASFVGKGADGALFGEGKRIWLLVLLGTFCFNFILIYRGVAKGIETFCRVAMPLMVCLAVIVLIRVLTLPPNPVHPDQSVATGLNFMWKPQPEKLLDPQTWLAASGQIFFSLSVGFGIIINYASYLKKNDDVALSGLTSSSMNEFFEVCLGGLITIPAAFIFLGAAAGSQGTFELGFVSLPNVFAQMPGGQLFGFLWFFMLFIAAITSSVSMLQPVIAFFEEGFGLKRHASAALLGLLSALGCLVVAYFSQGLVALDTFDFWVGSFLIFVLSMTQAVLYGWVFGITRGEEEAHRGAHLRIPRFVQYMLKFVVPVYLAVIFVCFCWDKLPSKEKTISDDTHKSFTTEVNLAGVVERTEVLPALRAEFAARKVKLADNAFMTAGEENSWKILTPSEYEGLPETLSFVLRPADKATTEIFEYKTGYVESIGKSRAAVLSLCFIGIIFAFLLVLVHIAGRRWKAQGRFDNLEQKMAQALQE